MRESGRIYAVESYWHDADRNCEQSEVVEASLDAVVAHRRAADLMTVGLRVDEYPVRYRVVDVAAWSEGAG